MSVLGLTDVGYDQPFEESVLLSFGLHYDSLRNFDVRLDFHNVLGWFDKDYNKRNYVLRLSVYRSEAAAFSLSVRHSFARH